MDNFIIFFFKIRFKLPNLVNKHIHKPENKNFEKKNLNLNTKQPIPTTSSNKYPKIRENANSKLQHE